MVIDNVSSLSILLGLMVTLVWLSNELFVIGIQYVNSIILSLFSFKMMISMDPFRVVFIEHSYDFFG